MITTNRFWFYGTLVYCLVSLVLIYLHDGYLIDDAGIYYSEAVKSPGVLYPSKSDFYSDFIWHPMVINISRLIFWLGGNLKFIQIINLILTVGILHGLRRIAKQLFNEKVSKITFLMCLFYPNFYIWNLAICSEIYFIFFLVLILNLYFSNLFLRYLYIGLLFPILDYSRELGLMVFLAFFVGNVSKFFTLNRAMIRIKELCLFSVGFIVVHLSIGKFHEYKTGIFWTKGSVLGYVVITGAVGDLVGENNNLAFQKGNLGFIPNAKDVSFFVKDSIWRKRGFGFIVEKPIEYIKLIPRKLFRLFYHDLAFVNFAFEKYSLYQMAKDWRASKSITHLIINYPFLWILNFWYYLLFSAQLFGIWICRRDLKVILPYLLLGILLIILPLLNLTQPRYHMPTFVLFLPFVAVFIDKKWKQSSLLNRIVGN
jgi:hypothetical protein